ncbi:MAG: protein-glutamate O-methyltransferase CheR [Myxococcales bacterium]|nr:protein-glutamate O-methyltransferase CheR [Myxococcales bacterium]
MTLRLPLSPQVFAILTHLIEEHSGLHYPPADRELIADRLSDRAVELGLGSLLDYYYFLRYDARGPAELGSLVEALVVQETYLFREVEPLRVLVQRVIPEMLREHSRIRIWSAACATGEEPYTLAMMLDEEGLLPQVHIVASDISARALERARRGIFAGRSLRSLPQRLPRHLVAEEPGRLRVSEDLRRSIDWRRVNLVDGGAVRALGVFHLVLCRNALIYFSDETVARVAQHLAEALQRDGFIVVGASESLLRFGTLLFCEERDGAFFYRKRSE